jgi:hypothetical protein
LISCRSHHLNLPQYKEFNAQYRARKAELLADVKRCQKPDLGQAMLNVLLDEHLEYESNYTHRDLPYT